MLLKKNLREKEKVAYNKTSLFLLPMLGMNFIELKENHFVNAYLGDDGYEIICDNHMFLLFNPTKFTVEFERFCQRLRENPMFSLEYDCPDYEHGKVIFVFGIPSEYLHIVQQFKDGQYSKMDKRYVNKFFPKFIDGKLSIRWKIFYKDPSLKKYWEDRLDVHIDDSKELWDIPEASEEIINYNKEQSNYW